MSRVVLKFGGASLKTPEHFHRVAKRIAEERRHANHVVIVASAMHAMTDWLIELAQEIHPNPPKREHDMLISVGERISISLLSMALDLQGIESVSLTGSQCGIITCEEHSGARILDVKPHRLLRHLEQNKVVIVAGFQGMSRAGDITTLGRNGSDTTAVALGVALQAQSVKFFKDVSGIFSEDPKTHPNATLLSRLSFEEALQIAERGEKKVLHPRSLLLAAKNDLPLHLVSFEDAIDKEGSGTEIYGAERSDDKPPRYESESQREAAPSA